MELSIRSGPDIGKTVEIGERLVIGREADCDLILDDPKVSRRHAAIAVTPGGVVTLEDLGSSNGTHVDGSKISGSQRVTGASKIRIGDTMMAVLVPQVAPPTVVDAPQDPGPPRTVGDDGVARGEASPVVPVSGADLGPPTVETPAFEREERVAPQQRSDPTSAREEASPTAGSVRETVADLEPATQAQLLAGGGATSAESVRQPTIPDPPRSAGETIIERTPVGGAATVADPPSGVGAPTVVDLEPASRGGETIADIQVGTRAGGEQGKPGSGTRKRLVIGGLAGLGVVMALALLVATLTGNGSSDPTPSASATISVGTPVEPPIAVTPDTTGWTVDPESWSVTLTWEAPSGSVDHYNVTRDGKSISTGLTATTYSDNNVEPGAIYHYRVVSVSLSGESAASKQRVRTPALPASLARLQGRFSVNLDVVSTNVGASAINQAWVFVPRCRVGPCSARWTVQREETRGVLAKANASYSAELSTPFWINDCNGNVVNERVEIHIRVTNGAVIGDAWRVTKIVGTLSESLAATSGCLAGSTAWRFSGSVVT